MKAVLLANMGAPVSEKGMKVFLKRMFSDKAILYAPAFVRSVNTEFINGEIQRPTQSKTSFGKSIFEIAFYFCVSI